RLSCVICVRDLVESLNNNNKNNINCESKIEEIINLIKSDLNKKKLDELFKHVLYPFDVRIESEIVSQIMICVDEPIALKLESFAVNEQSRRLKKTEIEKNRRKMKKLQQNSNINENQDNYGIKTIKTIKTINTKMKNKIKI